MIKLYEPSDRRVVCGVRCTWWDGIENVGVIQNIRGSSGRPLPGCPKCGSPLFQFDDPGVWWKNVEDYQAKGHPGYKDFISWMKGRCFASMLEAQLTYQAKAGRKVVI